ncbi:MAG TPA: hypothetical protein VNO21_14785, partial [Polyangiaceae bacterium]|nr:hypothetical protein [Polyangiaceae bacterium]
MRFFVHVTPIGKVETQSYCVEADSWQKALQNARTLRRETAPITGFSIELTDDGGCRAVDPAARLRYVVKRAPDTAVLTPGVLTPEASGPTRNSAFTKTIGYGTATRSSSSQIPPHPDATQAGMPGMIEDPHVLYRREQEPTEESPLLYREDVYVMAEGTSEAQAEKYLRAQFLTIKAVLASSGPGKYVNLAVYDRAFEGRPTILPLATLSWKDWKGQDPTVVHPRSGARHSGVARGEIASARVSDSGITVSPVVNVAPVPAAAAVPVPVPVAQPAAPPPAGPPPAIAALGEALRRASQPPPAPSPPIPTRASAPSVPNPAASVQAAGGRASADPLGATVMAESAPAFPPPARAPQRSAFVSTPEPRPVAEYGLAPSDPQARISSTGRGSTRPSRPSATGPRGRLRGDELIGVLFESMHDLHFSRDALEAAEFCL